MTIQGWTLILVFTAVIVALAKPMGLWLFAIYEGRRTVLHRVLGPVESGFYKLAGIDPAAEQGWRRYAVHMLLFQVALLLFTYVILRLQDYLPMNPRGLAGMTADGAMNTAVSFTTNTNWQWYAGEAALSNLSQMLGLTIHNFLSAATGIAVAFALFRGFARRETGTVGNFWADCTRVTLYVLLPICVIYAVFLIASGVPQTFATSIDATTLEGAKQTIVLGPVASQEAIKMLGTNGGGFFNANSAHPFENPTALVNFVQMLSIFLIGVGLTWCFGKAVGNPRQGWAILAAMMVLFLVGVGVTYWQEAAGNPLLHRIGLAGGNMEGKEVRFGIASSALYATVTTDASCGAVNAMHDSFTPLGGLVPLFNIQLGEVVFGGVGAGLYGMLVMAVLSVFIAGLMVGRTPEYLGKKIETRDVKYAMLYALVFAFVILFFTGWSAVAPYGLSSLNNSGPHGLTEMLYAFSSGAANNGSAFAGISANTPWYNTTLGLDMLFGRFWMILPALALAGSLAGKKVAPPGPGTLPTNGPLFAALLVGVVLIVGALTYFPALSLGPVVEHFAAQAGKVY
jgi:K+-transporting ATPase ATPase A chain